ncbi:MAG TPA: MGMT family protein [Roseiflexaceae bacterium]|nr:MGMT family protein [Roseiflexaceae bacterium]HMP40325.1 MGMT family protein [Roseiflexaceae bacterium]
MHAGHDGREDPVSAGLYERIYAAAALVPAGMVATYGDIAHIVGAGVDGRMVGEALAVLPKQRAAVVPWQRILSRDGTISTRGLQQQALLEAEGVAFDHTGRVILARHRWAGPSAADAARLGLRCLPPRDDAEQLSLL